MFLQLKTEVFLALLFSSLMHSVCCLLTSYGTQEFISIFSSGPCNCTPFSFMNRCKTFHMGLPIPSPVHVCSILHTSTRVMIFPIEIWPYHSPAYSSLIVSHYTSIKGQCSLMQGSVWPALHSLHRYDLHLFSALLSLLHTHWAPSVHQVCQTGPHLKNVVPVLPTSEYTSLFLATSFQECSNINLLWPPSSLLWWTLCLTHATQGKMCIIFFTSLRKTCNDSPVQV